MVTLRATRLVLSRLAVSPPTDAAPDTALGDWFVTRLVVDRQPLLLLISTLSYLPIITPARDVASLPDRLPELVSVRLRRMGIPADQIAAEVRAMAPVRVGPTNDRSVNGILTNLVGSVSLHLPINGWDVTTLPFVEANLAMTPWHASHREDAVIVADRKTPELLAARWGEGKVPNA
jgi:hypothetical protein